MSNKKNYSDLNPIEQRLFIGELLHACMNDKQLFLAGLKIIDAAKKRGHFEGVIFMPENWAETPEEQHEQ